MTRKSPHETNPDDRDPNATTDAVSYVLSVDADGVHRLTPISTTDAGANPVEVYPSDLTPSSLGGLTRRDERASGPQRPTERHPNSGANALPEQTLAREGERIFRWGCGCTIRLVPTDDQTADPNEENSALALVTLGICESASSPVPNLHTAAGPCWIGGRR